MLKENQIGGKLAPFGIGLSETTDTVMTMRTQGDQIVGIVIPLLWRLGPSLLAYAIAVFVMDTQTSGATANAAFVLIALQDMAIFLVSFLCMFSAPTFAASLAGSPWASVISFLLLLWCKGPPTRRTKARDLSMTGDMSTIAFLFKVSGMLLFITSLTTGFIRECGLFVASSTHSLFRRVIVGCLERAKALRTGQGRKISWTAAARAKSLFFPLIVPLLRINFVTHDTSPFSYEYTRKTVKCQVRCFNGL